jgi:hypothetical protein
MYFVASSPCATPEKTFAKLGFRVQTVLGLLPKFKYVLGVQSPSVFSSNKFCDFFRQNNLGNFPSVFSSNKFCDFLDKKNWEILSFFFDCPYD